MPKIPNTFFFLAPWSPNHWTTREFPEQILIFTDLHLSLPSNKKMTHTETNYKTTKEDYPINVLVFMCM